MCGENVYIVHVVPCDEGSPPRVRGKHLLKRRGVLPMRITPACAGKTRRIVQIFHTMKDHPRVCGENVKIGHPWKVSEGSPPRVRGKRIGAFSLRITEGITPACAGKTGF